MLHGPSRFTAFFKGFAMSIKGLSPILSLFLATSKLSAASPSLPPTLVNTLPNGVQIILQEDRSAKDVAYFMQWRTDQLAPSQPGIPHFVEHLIVSGEPAVDYRTLTKAKGIDDNQGNQLDALMFKAKVAPRDLIAFIRADRKRFAKLDVRMTNFNQALSELQEESDKANMRHDAWFLKSFFMEMVFQDPIYQLSDFTEMKEFRNISTVNAEEWYQDNIRPSNLTLSIVGNFDSKAIDAELTNIWSSLPNPKRVDSPSRKVSNPYKNPQRQEFKLFTDNVSEVQLGYPIPHSSHIDTAALDVLTCLLDDQVSGRLTKSMVSTKVSEYISASTPLSLRPHIFTINIDSHGTSEEVVLERLNDTLQQLMVDRVGESELQGIKAHLIQDYEKQLRSIDGRAQMLANYHLFYGSWKMAYERLQAYQNVTPDDIQRVVRLYFKDTKPYEYITLQAASQASPK
jgi:zinc protease